LKGSNVVRNSFKKSVNDSKVHNELQMSDVVNLDEDNPWLHPPENYGVALTGKAFDILINDPNQRHVLKKVLLKA
jgi:hypothetical protein